MAKNDECFGRLSLLQSEQVWEWVKSVLTCTIWSQYTPVPERQTDGRTSWQ